MSYHGKILRINLATKEIKPEELSKDLAKKYIGGRGLGTKIFSDEVDPKVDAFSPENKLIFATGALTSTIAPTGGRYMVITKSPLTGTIASSNSGGFFGHKLKSTGYDVLVFENKAEKPCYLYIDDKKAELRDAAHLWGKNTHETTDILMEEIGEKTAKVSCIGPGGENLSLISGILNDKNRAAGRSGVGAVMGSKMLKAIIVSGKHKTLIDDKEAFDKAVKQKIKILKENGVTGQGLPALGTKVLDNIINSSGLYPTRNFLKAQFEGVDEISGEALVEKGYLVKNVACYACPIACGRMVELPQGKKGEGPEYEPGWAFGALCEINDLNAISQANFMCNELGIDPISVGVTIATAMELYEKGYIKKEELEKGPELKFGNSEALLYYTKKLAYKEGFGEKMALGSYRLAESYGHPELSMTVKKMELPAYDPRGVQGQGLAYATSNRGGCHVRAYLIAPEIVGAPEKLDPQELKGKPEWVKIFQDLTAVIDSSGLCLFTSFALGAPDYAELLNKATGFNYSVDEMMQAGERIWNMERQFNLKSGLTTKDDTLPKRLLEDPIPAGPNKGHVHRLGELLPDYYKLRGWTEDGIPTDEKLKELEL
ncbi:MAG: aldehyde ferredoxin oxidoreductase family protein [Bacteroidales bacterium]|nr:aldehyde ferredoxin oxidoreductase family protein [Bacteroidales bacterium]